MLSLYKVLRVVPILCIILLSLAFYSYTSAVRAEREALEAQGRLIVLTRDLSKAFDYLTSQARAYVLTGQDEYLNAYLHERNTLRNRERIMSELEETGLQTDERALVMKAKEYSDELTRYESYAFDYIKNGDRDSAIYILFGDEYRHTYQSIFELEDSFAAATGGRGQADAEALDISVRRAGYFVYICALLSLLSSALFVAYHVSRLRLVGRLAAVALRAADGDFSADTGVPATHDEIGKLSEALSKLTSTASHVASDLDRLASQAAVSGLDGKSNVYSFGGQWNGMLKSLDSLIGEITHNIISCAPAAYAYVSDGCVSFCNDFARKKLQLTEGSRFTDLPVFPEEREKLLKLVEKNDPAESVTLHVKSPLSGDNFRRFRFSVLCVPAPDRKAFILWAVDVEENLSANETILGNIGDLTSIINTISVPLLLTNPATTEILFTNNAWLRLFENSGDVIGTPESNLFFDNETDPSEGKTVDFRYCLPSGKILDTRVTVRSVTYRGKTAKLKSVVDIGAEKLQLQLLQDAADHEHESNQLKNRFLISLSHEIRTPMNAIIGLTQLALLREQSAQDLDTLQKIGSSARGLMNVVNDILEFSKLEAQRVDLEEEEFNLEDIISSAFIISSSHNESRHAEMLLDIRPDVPYLLYGDKSRLWRILKSLLDNSVKNTDAGHVVLRVSVKQPITGKAILRFEVEDTGGGISSEQLSALFSPLKLSGHDAKPYNADLSMVITKQMTDLMGGQISVTNVPGQGTCYRVELPFQTANTEATIATLITKYTTRDYNILIVDDDLFSCNIMEKLLGQIGQIPVCVHSGAEAIEKASSLVESGSSLDLIILDNLLEDITTAELTRKLNFLCPSAKLILVSSYIQDVPNYEIKMLGFADVIQKPLVPSLFVRNLCDVLEDDSSILRLSLDSFEGANVLMVEDNLISQEVGAEMLKLLGIAPVLAEDATEALELLDKQDFHVILMDILLPGMSGVEITRVIRQSSKPYRNVPILAMTASIMPEQIEEYMKAGMNGHVDKPLEFEMLSQELSRVLPHHLRRRGLRVMDRVSAGFEIENVDVSSALARFGGDEAEYKEALRRYAAELSEIKPYDEALAGRDSSLRFFRRLISLTDSLGATKLARMMRDSITDLIDYQPGSSIYTTMQREASSLITRINDTI